MKRFFALLHERLTAILPIAPEDILADARNTKVPRNIDTATMYLRMYPPDVLTQLESLIKEAESIAHTEQNRGWIRLSQDYFDFLNLLTRMMRIHRKWQNNPSE